MATLCLLAGMRSDDMGIDIKVYVMPEYYAAQYSGIFEYAARYSSSVSSNLVYHLYSWIVINATKDFNAYLFFLSLAQVAPVYYVLFKLHPDKMWAGVLAFECVFYCFGFNIVKQCIAMSLLLVSYCYLTKGRPALSVLWFVLAFGCHEMSILGIVFYPAHYLMGEKSLSSVPTRAAGSIRLLGILLLVFLVMVVFVAARSLLVWLVESTGDYGYQMRNMGSGDIKLTYLVYVAALAALYWFYQKARFNYAAVRTEVFLSILGGVIMQLSVITPQAYRVGMFLLVFSVLAWPALCGNCGSKKAERAVCAIAIFVNVAFFVYVYLVSGAEGLYPYRSDILPFLQF